MLLFNYLTIIYKIFFLSIILENPILRLFILLIGLYYLKARREVTSNITLEDIKLTQPLSIIIAFVLTFITIISTLFFFRLNNLGKSIDLTQLYQGAKTYISTTPVLSLIGNSIYFIALLLLLIYIILYIRNFIWNQYNKIHIYICNNKLYEEYIIKRFWLVRFPGPFNRLKLKIMEEIWFIFLSETTYPDMDYYKYSKYANKYMYLDSYLLKLDKNLGLLLILLSIIYDMIFNNFILTKIYYIFPMAFLYIVYLSIVNFYDTRNIHLDRRISTLVYNEITTYTHEDQVIKVASGIVFNSNDLYVINLYIQNKFVDLPEVHDPSIFDTRIINVNDNKESK
jgi:hypothetical protein